MEDTKTNQLVGTCACFSKVGGFEPSYTYEVKSVVKKSKRLKVSKTIQYLQLKKEYSGPSEIGTLFLKPKVRRKGSGRLLSLSRFLFMAQYRKCFEDTVIAELRGVLNSKECSPFWNAVCKHFFKIDFKKADLMVMEDKSFIAELIPQHPIYIPLLPHSAQKVLGKVHKNTEPALHFLTQEGFEFNGEIDIFEAGPCVEAKMNKIRAVRKSQSTSVGNVVGDIKAGKEYIVAKTSSIRDFCVAMGPISKSSNGKLIINKEMATALNLDIGDKVRYVAAKG